MKTGEVLALKAEDVAALLQVPVGTVKYLHRVGQLRGAKVGRYLRWLPETVESYRRKLAAESN